MSAGECGYTSAFARLHLSLPEWPIPRRLETCHQVLYRMSVYSLQINRIFFSLIVSLTSAHFHPRTSPLLKQYSRAIPHTYLNRLEMFGPDHVVKLVGIPNLVLCQYLSTDCKCAHSSLEVCKKTALYYSIFFCLYRGSVSKVHIVIIFLFCFFLVLIT